MLWVAAGVLAVVSVLWYVGIGRVLAAQWTRRDGATVAPPRMVVGSLAPDGRALDLAGPAPPSGPPSYPGPPPFAPPGYPGPPPFAPAPEGYPGSPSLPITEPLGGPPPLSLDWDAAPPPEPRSLGPELALPPAPEPELAPPGATPEVYLPPAPPQPPPAAPPFGYPPPVPVAPLPYQPPVYRQPGAAPSPPLPRGKPRRSLPDLSGVFRRRAAGATDPAAWLADLADAPPVVASYAYPVLIDREFRVDYTRRVYINQACYVIVRIGAADQALAPLTPAEAEVLVTTPSQRLRFAAQEPEPRVRVALQYAEGTFYATRTTVEGVLNRDRDSRFVFVVKPLKAEDCVLTIAVSYVEATVEPEHVAQRLVIDRTIRAPGGEERHEHEEQITIAPAAPVEHLHPLLTTERVIGVKSVFRLNAGELGLVQKGAGVAVTTALVLLGVQQGQPLDLSTILLTLAPLVGIPVGDQVQKLFSKAGE